MADTWAHLIGFKPSAGLDEGIYRMRRGQRANLHKMGISRRVIEQSIKRSEGKK